MWAPGSPFLLTLDLGHSAADNVTHLQSLGHDQLLPPAVHSARARDCPETASKTLRLYVLFKCNQE